MIRKVFVLAVVVCLAALAGLAGDHGDKSMSAADHAAKLKAELNLTDEQAAQAEAIIAEDMAGMKEAKASIMAIKEEIKTLQEDAEGNAEAIEAKRAEKMAAKEQYAAGKKEHHARIRAILNEEQAAKFDEMMASHKKEGKMREKH